MFFSKRLKNISNLKHCFFSRKNGVSKGIYNSLNCGINSKDNKENVIQNINIVSKKLNCEKKPIVALNQNHGNKVVCFNNRQDVKNKIIGDAIVTTMKNVGISVLTADCVPILIYNPKKKIVGCVHAGWKGALNGIIENTVDKFLELNSNTRDLVVAIGPCINHHHYEVGHDFYKKFVDQNKNNQQFFIVLNDKKYLFNIRSYINAKLIRLGINNIDHIEMDTFSNKENFFSYRRSKKNDDKDYGRCISVIIMT
ncbi:MAG: peptidoglycan editing factor PgeF [Pelagibacteraceae bacterium]|nr:peptidoglycan editing factor PgeF [Pelagibacteraceae bacterium]